MRHISTDMILNFVFRLIRINIARIAITVLDYLTSSKVSKSFCSGKNTACIASCKISHGSGTYLVNIFIVK